MSDLGSDVKLLEMKIHHSHVNIKDLGEDGKTCMLIVHLEKDFRFGLEVFLFCIFFFFVVPVSLLFYSFLLSKQHSFSKYL